MDKIGPCGPSMGLQEQIRLIHITRLQRSFGQNGGRRVLVSLPVVARVSWKLPIRRTISMNGKSVGLNMNCHLNSMRIRDWWDKPINSTTF